ncbi:coiled-coil domain-containing protein 189 isoform X1 [Xyrichtys novacula]|uniref:Coiled-coil domain-containing protein 189 isoform X1 n=1 Tax=Xyrichtys novacula TaxID=13765 RepID=A0AAV1H5X8_XYRNO|nr:coiled-coil domain-containing protein 189 isoform X1 [Xyrichtys novacula]
MDTKIKMSQPQTLEAKVLLWTDISYHDMEQIEKMQSLPDLKSVLSSVLGVDLPEPKRGVLLELYAHTVLFCRESSLNKEQTSVLLSIIKSVHEANTMTPLNNIDDCFKYCKELLLCHSVRRPPFSINLFSPEEGSCILKYIYNSYVRHYKLYKYIFTPQVKLDLSLTYSESPNQDEEPKADSSSETQEAPIAEPNDTTLGSKQELKTLIEKEIREQMMFVSGQLDQRMREITNQHNSAPESPQPRINKAKK